MWSRLDDALIDHRKVYQAGAALGKNGAAVALGFYCVCLMWSNKHLTDGVVPREVLGSFPHVERPHLVADVLTHAGLFDLVDGGIRIHDFADYNDGAARVKQRRKADRDRKRELLA